MTGQRAAATEAAAVLDKRLDGDAHEPARPSWDCLRCEQPWPCPPARVQLSEAYSGNRIGLGMYLAGLYAAALAERPGDRPADLHERFVGWVR